MLLALAILALAIHALGSMGLMLKPVPSGAQFTVEICTSHGLVKLDPAHLAGRSSQPNQQLHDCCDLCGASGPLLAVSFAAPTPAAANPVAGVFPQSRPHRVQFRRAAHPARGPPKQA